jgi:hypothetical protein
MLPPGYKKASQRDALIVQYSMPGFFDQVHVAVAIMVLVHDVF